MWYSVLVLLMLAACLLLYLSSKQQAMLAAPLPEAPYRYLAHVLLLATLVGWNLLLSAVAAFFLWLMLLGCLLGTVPLLSLLRRSPVK
ncbi:hypothetical protein [Shewanella sp. YIC-542]|uniref:hypothetical protein n=1 Tax=Shewanella mytili TaxID=3377111 RepID=UPI00398F6581